MNTYNTHTHTKTKQTPMQLMFPEAFKCLLTRLPASYCPIKQINGSSCPSQVLLSVLGNRNLHSALIQVVVLSSYFTLFSSCLIAFYCLFHWQYCIITERGLRASTDDSLQKCFHTPGCPSAILFPRRILSGTCESSVPRGEVLGRSRMFLSHTDFLWLHWTREELAEREAVTALLCLPRPSG